MDLKAIQLVAEALSAGQTTPDILIAGTPGRAGDNGQSRPPAQNGRDGRNASCNWFNGCDSSTRGTKGNNGNAGENGRNGSDGGDAIPAKIFIGTVQGTVFVCGRGGNGGDGGRGGDGGNGGNGGTGGDGDKHGMYEAYGSEGGDGGNGGNGGKGGNGGNGGNGSSVVIDFRAYAPNSQIVPSTEPSRPGKSGQGGAAGQSGIGGRGGSRGGPYGDGGMAGTPGEQGKDGGRGGVASTFTIKQGAGASIGAKDINVPAGTIYPVTDRDCHFGTVTIKQGGILSIQTRQDVKINKLVKIAAPMLRSKTKTASNTSKGKARKSLAKAKDNKR
jgi:hypothetical protein